METFFNFESTSDLIDFIDHGSMSDVLSQARSGWLEGAHTISDLLQSLPIYIDPEKFWKEFNPAVTGLFFDIGLVCSGVPEHWLDPQPAFNMGSFVTTDPDEEKPIIKLGFNTTFPAGFSPAAAMERGAIMSILAYLLEQSGRSVSITQYCAIQKNNHNFKGSVVLKYADQPLDMDVLAFWLVCPNSFKQCWMRVLESLPHSKNLGITKGLYGLPDTRYGEEFSDAFIPGVYRKSQIWTREESVSWICTSLEKLKINYTLNN
jgi:hypothetical protein